MATFHKQWQRPKTEQPTTWPPIAGAMEFTQEPQWEEQAGEQPSGQGHLWVLSPPAVPLAFHRDN